MRVLALLLAVLGTPLALARVCSDPCLEAARTDYVECRRAARDGFALDRQLCRDRDPACVEACATLENDCDAATGAGPAVAACLGQQQLAIAGCARQFPTEKKQRVHCIDDARVAGFQCRNRVRGQTAPELRACRAEFDACTERCGPGEPPAGARLCEIQARRTRSSAYAACNRIANADTSGCRNKDSGCTETCRADRTTCNAPVRSALVVAFAMCDAERRAAATACEASNPAGSAALADCVETSQTNAFICRTGAESAQAPALTACEQQYVGCVRSCPAA